MTRQLSFQDAASTVKHHLDIVDVVGRHVSLKKAGRNYLGLCPFHAEKTPSFNVNRERQIYKCFGCGEGGDSLSFLMKIENKTYGELIHDLAEDQGIEIIRDGQQTGPSKSETEILFNLNIAARQYFETQLAQSPQTQAYLAQRQITPAWQVHFGIGYAPAGWENLILQLQQAFPQTQDNPKLLDMAGLVSTKNEGNSYYDRFRNRLMIPIQDERGRVVAFGGRALVAEDNPKYLNSPETAIYVKNKVLYGLFQAKESIRQHQAAILMEGYFDVIAAHMAGLTHAVGICGTALTDNHLKLLHRMGAETLYLSFDADEAGQTAALRAIELIEHQVMDKGIKVKVVTLPQAKDPDEFLQQFGKDAFEQLLLQAPDFLTFKFQKALSRIPNTKTPEGRVEAVNAVLPILINIQQPVLRQEYVKSIAEQLQLTEETLTLEIKRLENNNPTFQNKKNYEFQAIFNSSARYLGRKQKKPWTKAGDRPRLEDMIPFRQRLSETISLDEKEHWLLSYLFVSEESYQHVMSILQQLPIQSAQGKQLLAVLQQLSAQWDSIENLVETLTQFCHTQQPQLIPFLAHELMLAERQREPYQFVEKDLKSDELRVRLSQNIHAIAETIRHHRHQAQLSNIAQSGKNLEAQSDDTLALEVQRQLRDALKSRSSRSSSPQNLSVDIQQSVVIEEIQGV